MVKHIFPPVSLTNTAPHLKHKLNKNELKIFLYNGNINYFNISFLSETTTSEDICLNIARNLGIGTLSFYLFSLFIPSKQIWIPPCNIMMDYLNNYSEIYFRLRFLPSQLSNLLSHDNIAFSYLFYQTRHDFLNSHIPNINTLNISDCLGLAVTDILRMKQKKMFQDDVDYKDFIPINNNAFYNRLRLLISGSKAIKEALLNYEHQINDHENLFYEERYVNTLIKVPDYFVEKYNVGICGPSDINQKKGIIYIEPKNDKNLMFKPEDSKNESVFLCNIRDLCFITLKTFISIEICRKNGIPIYLNFENSDSLFSLLSLLDGYYRLSEKFNFNLCTKCYSPLVLKLKSMNIHGPVNEEFVISKLKEKAKNNPGTFLIRQSKNQFNSYILDICIDQEQLPKSLYIINEDFNNEHSSYLHIPNYKTNTIDSNFKYTWPLDSNGSNQLSHVSTLWRFETSTECFHSLKNLLTYYSTHSLLKFKHCLPPSDYEHSNLLICHHNLHNILHGKNFKTSDVRCIMLQDLIFPVQLSILLKGEFGATLLPNVFWEKDKITRLSVSVKLVTSHYQKPSSLNKDNLLLNQQCFKDADQSIKSRELVKYSILDPVSKILKMMNAYAFLNDPTIIKTYGICLDPIMIVTEPLPLGSLDLFLRSHANLVKTTELLEACSSISKALWYLEECKLPHGNLRCSNIYVHSHAQDKLSVKLSDPIITMEHGIYANTKCDEDKIGIVLRDSSFLAQRLPWLAPEHFNVVDYQHFKPSLVSDVWAYGTTVWEIFNFGEYIPWGNMKIVDVKENILKGNRPPKPSHCSNEIYYLMNECWTRNKHMRKKIQELVRDVHQIYHHALNSQTRLKLKRGTLLNIHNYELLENLNETAGSGLNKHSDNFPDLRRALPPIPIADVFDTTFTSETSYDSSNHTIIREPLFDEEKKKSRNSRPRTKFWIGYETTPKNTSHLSPENVLCHTTTDQNITQLPKSLKELTPPNFEDVIITGARTNSLPGYNLDNSSEKLGHQRSATPEINYSEDSYGDNYSNTSIDHFISKLLSKATANNPHTLSKENQTNLGKSSCYTVNFNSSAIDHGNLYDKSLLNLNKPIDRKFNNCQHSEQVCYASTKLPCENYNSTVTINKEVKRRVLTWASTHFNLVKNKFANIKDKSLDKNISLLSSKDRTADIALSRLPKVSHDLERNKLNNKDYQLGKSNQLSRCSRHNTRVNNDYVALNPNHCAERSSHINDKWIIDDHEITYLKKLGEGNFGEVWLALWSPHCGLDEQKVAVKKLKRYENVVESADLDNEIEIMKRLSHPNIVEIKGICQNYFKQLVVEYLSTGSLENFLKAFPHSLSAVKKLAYAKDISAGMEYLASQGIVHRDLAARNILITDNMNTVKISDFGLSKSVEKAATTFSHDGEYDYKGYLSGMNCDYEGYYAARTPRKLPICWYAPETINPSCTRKRFNQRTDVWSFGVTLWELYSQPSCQPQNDLVSTILTAIMDKTIQEDSYASIDFDSFLSLLTPESFVTKLYALMALQGWRLPQPDNCPMQIYHMMNKCWLTDQNQRPTFTRLNHELTLLSQT